MRKIQAALPRICKMMETVIAVLVMIAMVCYLGHLIFQTRLLPGLFTGETEFTEILETGFGIVIGIEFIEMLCHPDSQTVLEVLIFLIARHMIIETPSPGGLVLLVLSVCILCIVRRGLHIMKLKTADLEHDCMEKGFIEEKQK